MKFQSGLKCTVHAVLCILRVIILILCAITLLLLRRKNRNSGSVTPPLTRLHFLAVVAYSMYWALLHEMGHVIGLPHSENTADIMYK